jgi:hypothetical protein
MFSRPCSRRVRVIGGFERLPAGIRRSVLTPDRAARDAVAKDARTRCVTAVT